MSTVDSLSNYGRSETARAWLPGGKVAAVSFTIDDIHPGKSSDAYEAGGDLGRGALGHVEWLLERHPLLRVTLFTTANWRELSPLPTHRIAAQIPFLREYVYLGGTYRPNTMRLDRHPEFVAYLKALPRTEIAFHGLHHVHRGRNIPVEFQRQSFDACCRMLDEMKEIFQKAGLPCVSGMSPPGWNLSPQLAQAMAAAGLSFVASARDITTPVSPSAVAAMSGLQGASLIYPESICEGKLLHFTTNFQATSSLDRALQIIDNGGILCVKAHIIKKALGYVALDGLDYLYRNYLDLLFGELFRRYGDALWWTSLGQIADYHFAQAKLGEVHS